MGTIKIFRDGQEINCEPVERVPVSVECWYDPHFRHWVLYPVDAEGNQLEEATYEFGKKNALARKAEMMKEIGR